MDKCFSDLIGRTVEAYVDGIVVKTKQDDGLVADLELTFAWLRLSGVWLNLEKCVFGVPCGMLLGFIVFQRGTEANPDKINATKNVGPIVSIS